MLGDQDVNISLLNAVNGGSLERTRELINSYGLSYSQAWAGGFVLLCNALKNNHVAVAELLLTSGSEVNKKSNNNDPSETPLHFAVINGDIGIVKMLVDKGAYINAMNQSGRTPLHNAIENRKMKGSKEVVNLLLRRGANVNVKGENNITPLHIAAMKGYTSIAKDLLNHGACIHSLTLKEGYTPLHFACELGNEETVKLFLNRGAHINTDRYRAHTPLYVAIKKGCKTVVKLLLQHGAKVNNKEIDGKTILHNAVKNKQEEVVKLLINYKANINAKDNVKKTPIFYAIKNADVKITKLLLTNRANIKDSSELLNIAVQKKCIETVEALLQHGADINASDVLGRTALHFTALSKYDFYMQLRSNKDCLDRGGDIEAKIAKLLVSKGANIDAPTKDNLTTLHAAIYKGYSKLVKALLNKGANVNAKLSDGVTALHIAAKNGHKEVVKVLLEYGAKIDSKAKDNMTPLHMGAKNGHREIIETLLKFGADINITSGNNYRTPLDHAENSYKKLKYQYNTDTYNFYATVEFLKRHIVKMKTANLYVSEKNLRSMTTSNKISDFQDKCEEEITRMKSEKINNSTISFYDILVKDRSSLAILAMGNENIVPVLKSNDHKIKFPIYASMIETNFRKSMERKELFQQDNKIFHFLFNNFPECPYHCIEKIFSYFSEEDLRILVEACKPLSISNPNTNVNDVVVD